MIARKPAPAPEAHATGYCQTLPVPRYLTLEQVNALWAEVWARVDGRSASTPDRKSTHVRHP